MIQILSRKLTTALKETRCNAHNGMVKLQSQCCLVRIKLPDHEPFNVHICRVCDNADCKDIIDNMKAEAKRHVLSGEKTTAFTRLMAKQE